MTSREVPESFRELAHELRERMAGLGGGLHADEAFDELALRVFHFQYRANPAFGRFCDARGAGPDRVSHWSAIPAVPTTAFKHLPLVSGDPAGAERVFRTSGTREGYGRRGEHRVLDLNLYRASLLPPFRSHLLPDGLRPRVLSLITHPDRQPDSSLSFMVGAVVQTLGGEGSEWFLDPHDGLREAALFEAVGRAESNAEPVLVAATGFALVHWLDAMDRHGWRARLPEGSRMMETGGFKGRSRMVSKEALYESVSERMGIPPTWIVNEYGMTELLSQFYEPVLHEGEAEGGPSARRLVGPPWVRTRVLDPSSLEPVPGGREGVLAHMDLANIGSVAHVLTEDRGVQVEGGFRVLGRLEASESRGCSIAVDELLEAARD